MILIKDRNNAGAPSHPLVLQWREGVPLTVRELIAERVRQEWERREDAAGSLVSWTGAVPDADSAIDIAVTGFLGNAFFVLVDERQVTDLDTVITYNTRTDVTFIRLTPLVGG